MIHVAYVYILFPFLLFCVGWLRWYYAVGMAIILIASYILSIKNTKEYIAVDIKKHTSKIILARSVIIIVIFFPVLANIVTRSKTIFSGMQYFMTS